MCRLAQGVVTNYYVHCTDTHEDLIPYFGALTT